MRGGHGWAKLLVGLALLLPTARRRLPIRPLLQGAHDQRQRFEIARLQSREQFPSIAIPRRQGGLLVQQFCEQCFVFQSAVAAYRARPTQASRTPNAPHSGARWRSRFLFILFHLFRLLMQLRKSHTHQQRELGPRLKSAFLNTSFLFQRGLMASQCIGLHRHGKASPLIKSRFETEELRLPLLKKKEAANRGGPCIYAPGSFWNWSFNSSSAFSARSSKWPPICNFTSATCESGCRLGFSNLSLPG